MRLPPLAGFDPIDPAVPTSADDTDSVTVAVRAAVTALGDLTAIDPGELDGTALAELVEGVEQLRRMVETGAATVAGCVDERNPFREQGYFNAKTYLKQRAQLSGVEAHRRIRTTNCEF